MSFFGAIVNAFHSAEMSIEHTAKNVAREAAQAEKSVVKTVLHVEKQVEHTAKVVVYETVQISKEANQPFHSEEKSIEPTASLTNNKKTTFFEIDQTGAKIIGKGKPPYTGGSQIPPMKLNIKLPK